MTTNHQRGRRGPAARGSRAAGISNAAWLLVGNVVYGLGQWLTLVAIARLGDSQLVGRYALALAVSAPVVLTASLALRTVQATDAAYRYRFADYLSLRLCTMLGAFAVIGLIATLVPGPTQLAVVIVGAAKCLDGIGDVFYGAFQRSERMAAIGISLSANGLLTFALVAILLAWSDDLGFALIGSVVSSALASVLYCVLKFRRSAQHVPPLGAEHDVGAGSGTRPAALASLVRYSLPLGIASGVMSLSSNVPRYVLDLQVSTRALGIFTAISMVAMVANTAVGAIAHAVMPGFARTYLAGDHAVLRSQLIGWISGSLAVGGVLTVLGAFVGRPLLSAVYGSEYAAQVAVLLWTLAATGIVAATWFVNAALSASGRFGSQLGTNLVGLGVAAAASWSLIGAYGITGAAAAVAISATVQLVIKSWIVLGIGRRRQAEADR